MAEVPVVERTADLRSRVVGTCFRAVDPAHRDRALDGSRAAGRYSSPGRPTLYLSASPEGVDAAMIAHGGGAGRLVVRVAVEADDLVDLRDPAACAAVGVDPSDAAAAWQGVAEAGRIPPSWRVRDAIEASGAAGLIDASRQRPGLWHLVLFRWNAPGAPTADLLPEVRRG